MHVGVNVYGIGFVKDASAAHVRKSNAPATIRLSCVTMRNIGTGVRTQKPNF